jgi:hypothetical protein
MEVERSEWPARGWVGGGGVEDEGETWDMLHELLQQMMAKLG